MRICKMKNVNGDALIGIDPLHQILCVTKTLGIKAYID